MVKNSSFKDVRPDWYLLFSEKNIFTKFQRFQSSVERTQLNLIILEKALESDITFMVEELLDGRTPVTDQIIELMLRDN